MLVLQLVNSDEMDRKPKEDVKADEYANDHSEIHTTTFPHSEQQEYCIKYDTKTHDKYLKEFVCNVFLDQFDPPALVHVLNLAHSVCQRQLFVR